MSALLHAIVIVLLIGLGDSLNPTTLGPALYLVTIDHPRRRLIEFLIGVLVVNLLGGLVIMLGPGQLLLSLVPKPDPTTKHIIELVAGAALIVIAVLLWFGRQGLGRRKPPVFSGNGRSGVMLGAGIAAVEFPDRASLFRGDCGDRWLRCGDTGTGCCVTRLQRRVPRADRRDAAHIGNPGRCREAASGSR